MAQDTDSANQAWRVRGDPWFVQSFTDDRDFDMFMNELKSMVPIVVPRPHGSGSARERWFIEDEHLCFGWSTEPRYQYSWGGHDYHAGTKLWGHQEFLDAVGFNMR